MTKKYNLKAGDGLGDKLYNGAASFGRFNAIIGIIIASFIGGIFIIIGLFLLIKKNRYTNKVEATVKTATCNKITNAEQQPIISCALTLEYHVNGKLINGTLYTNDREYKIGDKFPVYYNDQNPQDVLLKPSSNKMLGGILLGVGLVLILFTVLHYYIVSRFKFAAAASGVGNAYNMIT